MPISNHDLFRNSGIDDKLDLLQSLLDSRMLTSEEAVALLNAIRSELEATRAHRSSIYVHYGQVIQSLHTKMPDVYEQVVQAWQAKRGIPGSAASSWSRPLQTERAFESDEDFFEAERLVEEKPAHNSQEIDSSKESSEESATEVDLESSEGEAEYEQPEEEHENEAAEQVENEEEEQEEEKEEIEDEKDEAESDEKNEFKVEVEGAEPETEESESEEVEAEAGKLVVGEEAEMKTEAKEASEEIESEAETQEEGDRMATEAAEAAHAAEQTKIEIEGEESVGEEEPPVGAAE